jgi:hypothetical protein
MTTIYHNLKPVASFEEYQDAVMCLKAIAEVLRRTLTISITDGEMCTDGLPKGVVVDNEMLTATP